MRGAAAARSCLGSLLLLQVACASAGKEPERPGTSRDEPRPESIRTSTSLISDGEAISLEELLDRADRQLEEEDYGKAASSYELAVEHATLDENRLRGLFGWGTALDLGGRPRDALRTYSRYVAEAPPGPRRDEAAVRKIRLLVYLERYEEAGVASSTVDISQRTPLQQLALLAARAHHQLEKGELDIAARTISKGRSIVDAQGLDRVTVPPTDVASLFFALGQLRFRRAEEITFDPLPENFTQVLEDRCQLILDAQSAYSETMRSRDAHWSSMAGVKVGQLYKNLYRDLMAIGPPEAAGTAEKRQLFEGAMRLRYSILLRKSLSMMEATVSLLERTHQESPWRQKAHEALEEIREAQKIEESAIDALPYSRAQLQQVLDEMAQRAKSSVSGKTGT